MASYGSLTGAYLGVRLFLLRPPTGNEAHCRERGADEEKRSRLGDYHRLQVALVHEPVRVTSNLVRIEEESMREAPKRDEEWGARASAGHSTR